MPSRAGRRSFPKDVQAASEVIGPILLVAVAVLLAAVYFFLVSNVEQEPERVESGARATYWTDGYWIEPTGPDSIPVAGSNMHITLDGVEQVVPLSQFGGQLGGAAEWDVGTRLCIVGSAPGCFAPQASSVQVTVYTATEYVFSVRDLQLGVPAFDVGPGSGGGITILTNVPVRIDNVGSQITCGQSGPQIPVSARLTQDGGASYAALWGGGPLNPNGGETLLLPSVAVGSVLGVEATFSGGGCSSRTHASVPANPNVLVLTAGDPAPNKPPYAGQAPLATFLQPYVNTATQSMVLDYNQVILLFEYVTDLSSDAADFQDLVILFTIG
ncbi:MAG TPA: type IV pilin [Candidatus Thermoplasmatota archaeon]|nr:type IV pilin [Candidatus Thermoplasmatota archaeon]